MPTGGTCVKKPCPSKAPIDSSRELTPLPHQQPSSSELHGKQRHRKRPDNKGRPIVRMCSNKGGHLAGKNSIPVLSTCPAFHIPVSNSQSIEAERVQTKRKELSNSQARDIIDVVSQCDGLLFDKPIKPRGVNRVVDESLHLVSKPVL